MESALKKEEEEEKDGAGIAEREIALKRAATLRLPKAMKRRAGGGKEWGKRHGEDAGTTDLLPYHRKKLRALLEALVQQHNFSPAAGVVSALLGAGNNSYHMHERDFSCYWEAMEVSRQLEGGSIISKATSLKIKRLYRILQRKQPNARLRGQVQLELALYLLSQGDSDSHEAAYNEIRPIVDVPPFRDDATMNLCYGLILHQLWYDRAVVDVEKHFIEDIGTKPGNASQDYEEGCGENDTMEVKVKMEHHSIDVTGESGPSIWLLEQQQDFELRENLAALDISGNSCGSSQGLQQQGLYEGDDHEHPLNNSWQTASVLWSPGMKILPHLDCYMSGDFVVGNPPNWKHKLQA